MVPYAMHLSSWLMVNLICLCPAKAVPDCEYPAPPAASVPSLIDCLAVVSAIYARSRFDGNLPWTWTRYPPAVRGVQLPATYSYSSGSNDCEFIIDVVEDRGVDILPPYRIAEVAGDLVHHCLLGPGPEASTIGNDTVRPRNVVSVALRRKMLSVGVRSSSARRTHFNITGTTLLSMEDRLARIID